MQTTTKVLLLRLPSGKREQEPMGRSEDMGLRAHLLLPDILGTLVPLDPKGHGSGHIALSTQLLSPLDLQAYKNSFHVDTLGAALMSRIPCPTFSLNHLSKSTLWEDLTDVLLWHHGGSLLPNDNPVEDMCLRGSWYPGDNGQP